MSLRIGKKVAAVAVSVAPVVGAMAAKAFVDFQNGSLVTTEYAVKSCHVPKSLDGFRIAHIADLHDATFGFQNERLVNAVRDAKPDLIILAGDMIHKDTLANAMAFVRHATSIAPVVFVPGNHEASSSRYPEFRRQLIQAGAFLLEDDMVTEKELGLGRSVGAGLVRIPAVTVIGVADPSFSSWLERAEPDRLIDRKLDELLDQAASSEKSAKHVAARPFRIIVSHRPEYFASYAREGVDLVLSGHAHGGQWRLPVIGGLYAPSQGILPKYVSGMHEEGNTSMVVSRGLGNSGFPLRLNNRPEVAVITLCSDGRIPSPVDFRKNAKVTTAIAGVSKARDMARGSGKAPDNAKSGLRAGGVFADAIGDGDKTATREFIKTAAREAAIKELPHVIQEVVGALTPLVVSALVGKTFLAGKVK